MSVTVLNEGAGRLKYVDISVSATLSVDNPNGVVFTSSALIGKKYLFAALMEAWPQSMWPDASVTICTMKDNGFDASAGSLGVTFFTKRAQGYTLRLRVFYLD